MENKFIDGLFIDKPRQGAPDFAKASLGINVEKFTNYIREHENEKGYVNIDILLSREGKLYCKLNDWKPNNNLNGIWESKNTTTK